MDEQYKKGLAILYAGAKCHGIQFDEFGCSQGETECVAISAPERCKCDDKDISGEELLKMFKREYMNLLYKYCDCETDEDRAEVDKLIKIYGKVRAGEQWTQEDYDKVISSYRQRSESVKNYKEI